MYGQRLKERRLQFDMTQDRLGKLIGVRNERIIAWESGREDIPASKLALLAKALSCSSDWLLGITEEIPPRQARKLSREEITAVKILRAASDEKRHRILQIMRLV